MCGQGTVPVTQNDNNNCGDGNHTMKSILSKDSLFNCNVFIFVYCDGQTQDSIWFNSIVLFTIYIKIVNTI